jgi:multiple sugar transport system permease protein
MREPWYQRVTIEALVALAAVLFVLPVVFVYLTSLKPDREIVKFESVLPKSPREGFNENYEYVLRSSEEIPIFRWLVNSILISSSVTVLVLTVDSLAAYALARLNLPGKRYVFGLIIATLMVPGQILLVPVYLILSRLHWIDSPLALYPGGGRRVRRVSFAPVSSKPFPKYSRKPRCSMGAAGSASGGT